MGVLSQGRGLSSDTSPIACGLWCLTVPVSPFAVTDRFGFVSLLKSDGILVFLPVWGPVRIVTTHQYSS
jgi:hypothetical protein